MTEIEKKANRRRRRRPRQRGREEQASAKPEAPAPAPVAESAPTRPPANENRQRRVRRAHTPERTPERRHELRVHEQTMGSDMGISPLDPKIVLYTYTLRPRGMAEGYGSGPGLADKMIYEQRDASD